jgi:hypothetical protein
MSLVPFSRFFPELALAETRVLTIRNHNLLPDDEYALVEFYCPDPTCDCRRVILNVIARHVAGQDTLAAISFAFDRDAEFAGPSLDLPNLQTFYAEALLELVTSYLEREPVYVARLESHYRQVKQAVADPDHPIHEVIKRLSAEREKGLKRPRRRRKRKK